MNLTKIFEHLFNNVNRNNLNFLVTKGFGFELQMLENRITMFLLHYLYYVPVIYYLSKDEIFYNNSSNKQPILVRL